MAAQLSRTQQLEIRLALEDLNAAFAEHLDLNRIDALVDLFTADALYTNGPRESHGRAEIEQLFQKRQDLGPRTSRHICSGLRIEIVSEREATGRSVCLSFAADGLPPLPATPFLVGDFVDRYWRDDDGRWRFAERHIRRVFVNEEPRR